MSPVPSYNEHVLLFQKVRRRTHPQLRAAPVGDDVVDVPVVAQAQCGAAHQRTHVQRQDGDEQRFSAFQVAVKQNGYENNLREGKQGESAERRHGVLRAQATRTPETDAES